MRSFLYLLCFLLILPALAAAGHDFYYAYQEHKEIKLDQPFEQSDLGWLMVNYTPDIYNMGIDTIDKETWQTYIYPLLLKKAWIVLSIPAAAFIGLVFLLRLFGIWPFNGEGLLLKGRYREEKSEYGYGYDTPKKRAKYSRK